MPVHAQSSSQVCSPLDREWIYTSRRIHKILFLCNLCRCMDRGRFEWKRGRRNSLGQAPSLRAILSCAHLSGFCGSFGIHLFHGRQYRPAFRPFKRIENLPLFEMIHEINCLSHSWRPFWISSSRFVFSLISTMGPRSAASCVAIFCLSCVGAVVIVDLY